MFENCGVLVTDNGSYHRFVTLNINGLSAGVKSVIYYVGKEPIELWTTPFNSRGGWGRPEYFN